MSETISRFMFTQATREMVCPKCNAAPGEFCHTPKGRKAIEPHMERCVAYRAKIGDEEWERRHSVKVTQGLPFPFRAGGAS